MQLLYNLSHINADCLNNKILNTTGRVMKRKAE